MAVLDSKTKGKIAEIALRFGASNIRVFGSFARGTAGSESDLDLLVRFQNDATLITVISFKQELEAALGNRVDVVDEGGLSRYMAPRILSEALPLGMTIVL